MKKSIFKSAIASAVILASSQSFAAPIATAQDSVQVDFLKNTSIVVAMATASISLSPSTLSGSATGCAYSSTGGFTISSSSFSGGFLVGTAGSVPYTQSASVTGANSIPGCAGGSNIALDASVSGADATAAADGGYSDTVTITVTTI